MKTKYIEGTNKEFSIREDGTVIKHVVLVNNNRDSIIITINGKRVKKNIKKLISIHFNKITCIHCKDKCNVDQNHKSGNICIECRRKASNIKNKIHRDKYPKKYKEKSIKAVKDMTTGYVAKILGLKVKDLNPEVVELKRKQLLLYRELNN